MSENIIISLIAFAGTLGGTCLGILKSTALTTYRIKQLENKVDKHNNFAVRMPVIEEQIKAINHRLDDLEKERN